MEHLTDKNIALDLVRVTEAAALASAKYAGRGNKEEADGAAVDAMRIAFHSLNIDGEVVIGEGEKDHAPMLYNGERVGNGNGPKVEIAVDPVEGTSLCAYGKSNSISVVGMVEAGHMFRPGRSYYCQKLAVGADAASVIDLDAPIKDNIIKVAKAKGKTISEIVVFVLNKPRHEQLIKDILATGARVQLHSDGDVAGSLLAVDPRSDVDLLVGIGGTPEVVISACAIKGTGGQILTRLAPKTEEERRNIIEDGIDLNAIRSVDDIITSEKCFFAATGITNGQLLKGVTYKNGFAVTSSLTTRGKTGTMRYIEAWHNIKKLSSMSSVKI